VTTRAPADRPAAQQGRLFDFEGIDRNLDLVPLAVRRLLDHLGAKLSLDGWRSIELESRHVLLALGSADRIDPHKARTTLASARPSPRAIDPSADPTPEVVPEQLAARLGEDGPLDEDTWRRLSPLERWVLEHVSNSKHPERLVPAVREILADRNRAADEGRQLTHLNRLGEVHMVSIVDKPVTLRRAVAISRIVMSEQAHRCLLEGNARKGDVLGAARIAGIMAAKQTSALIPLCHPVPLTQVELDIRPDQSEPWVDLRAEATVLGRTGVEMEVLMAVSVAALTVYDMLKSVDRGMVIGPTRLLEKSGGTSGEVRP